ncbi:hypothetical protein B0T18DRAFT_409190 [Schizothecium vesticola]|uniref:BZIP domain-containing protein n=1 Tax=Schizothecium vesticola TaxID=314040 RepID=A0AA40F3Z0_9PEZI|nr:hypothetical protein B0T18DRAFT_409190 [Schizothecium vesticola]
MPPQPPYESHIQKFRANPRDNAARIRENQRRHRARVKSRIEELETALCGTQAKLDEALAVIEKLRTELRNCASPAPPRTVPLDEDALVSRGCCASATAGPSLRRNDSDGEQSNSETEFLTQAAPRPPSRYHLSTVPETQTELGKDPDPQNAYAHLPPPCPGESTMLCRDAYSILRDRAGGAGNWELDMGTVTEWLKPGFRGAVVPGGGCRVQTQVLFWVVDRMT